MTRIFGWALLLTLYAPVAFAQIEIGSYNACIAVAGSEVNCQGARFTFVIGVDSPRARAFIERQIASAVERKLSAQSPTSAAERELLIEQALTDLESRFESLQAEVTQLANQHMLLEAEQESLGLAQTQTDARLAAEELILAEQFQVLMELKADSADQQGLYDRLTQRVAKLEGKLDETTSYSRYKSRGRVGLSYMVNGFAIEHDLLLHGIAVSPELRAPGPWVIQLGLALSYLRGSTDGFLVGSEPQSPVLERVEVSASGWAIEPNLQLGYEWRQVAVLVAGGMRSFVLRFRHPPFDRVDNEGREFTLQVGTEVRLFSGLTLGLFGGYALGSEVRSPRYAYDLLGQSVQTSSGTRETPRPFARTGVSYAFSL